MLTNNETSASEELTPVVIASLLDKTETRISTTKPLTQRWESKSGLIRIKSAGRRINIL
jgi:hypothetical protein